VLSIHSLLCTPLRCARHIPPDVVNLHPNKTTLL
jgi:hypothetical protein